MECKLDSPLPVAMGRRSPGWQRLPLRANKPAPGPYWRSNQRHQFRFLESQAVIAKVCQIGRTPWLDRGAGAHGLGAQGQHGSPPMQHFPALAPLGVPQQLWPLNDN